MRCHQKLLSESHTRRRKEREGCNKEKNADAPNKSKTMRGKGDNAAISMAACLNGCSDFGNCAKLTKNKPSAEV
jgi:hypothetical protein